MEKLGIRAIGRCTKVEIDGANARDLLSNERTYLAYTRSAFACVSLGLALAYLPSNGDSLGPAAGLALVVIGAVLLLYSAPRTFVNAAGFERGSFAVDALTPVLFGAAVFAVGVAALVLVILRAVS